MQCWLGLEGENNRLLLVASFSRGTENWPRPKNEQTASAIGRIISVPVGPLFFFFLYNFLLGDDIMGQVEAGGKSRPWSANVELNLKDFISHRIIGHIDEERSDPGHD